MKVSVYVMRNNALDYFKTIMMQLKQIYKYDHII